MGKLSDKSLLTRECNPDQDPARSRAILRDQSRIIDWARSREIERQQSVTDSACTRRAGDALTDRRRKKLRFMVQVTRPEDSTDRKASQYDEKAYIRTSKKCNRSLLMNSLLSRWCQPVLSLREHFQLLGTYQLK